MSQSQKANIGWGVALHDPEGEGTHPSLLECGGAEEDCDGCEAVDLYSLLAKDAYRNVLEYETAGTYDYGYPVIYLKRGYIHAYWGHTEIENPGDLFSYPTAEEMQIMQKFLDEAGFTGNGHIELILSANYG